MRAPAPLRSRWRPSARLAARLLLAALAGPLVVVSATPGVAGAVPVPPSKLGPTNGPGQAPGNGPACYNVSTLNPKPAVWIGSSDLLSETLIDAGFTRGNHWAFDYASNVGRPDLETKLLLKDYFAWVVNEPRVTGGDGSSYGGRHIDEDRGGAVFQFQYTPIGQDPLNVHFLSAYAQNVDGVDGQSLDHLTPTSPFYDVGGAAGRVPGTNKSWFLDVPSDPCLNPCVCAVDIRFNTMIATEHFNTVTGTHEVTVYEGIAWGYDYRTSALVAPEPAGVPLLAAGAMVIFVVRRMRRDGGR